MNPILAIVVAGGIVAVVLWLATPPRKRLRKTVSEPAREPRTREPAGASERPPQQRVRLRANAGPKEERRHERG